MRDGIWKNVLDILASSISSVGCVTPAENGMSVEKIRGVRIRPKINSTTNGPKKKITYRSRNCNIPLLESLSINHSLSTMSRRMPRLKSCAIYSKLKATSSSPLFSQIEEITAPTKKIPNTTLPKEFGHTHLCQSPKSDLNKFPRRSKNLTRAVEIRVQTHLKNLTQTAINL